MYVFMCVSVFKGNKCVLGTNGSVRNGMVPEEEEEEEEQFAPLDPAGRAADWTRRG